MNTVDYRLLGKESTSWQKKYFFREVGRGGNPDSTFILLLTSKRGRAGDSPDTVGSELFAKLVDQYGRSHLTETPRETVRRFLDIVGSDADRARESKIEVAAGFLHFKGRRAAAGSFGRLRAGLADRDSTVTTSPVPKGTSGKGGAQQVALDLGQTVEADLDERPAFFIAPSSAMAVGDEVMRKFIWDFISGEGGLRGRSPGDWKHLPCLVGKVRSHILEEQPVKAKKKVRFGVTRSKGQRRPPAPVEVDVVSTGESAYPGEPKGIGRIAGRTALWVILTAAAAFVTFKFWPSGGGETGREPPAVIASAESAGGEGAEGVPREAVQSRVEGGAGESDARRSGTNEASGSREGEGGSGTELGPETAQRLVWRKSMGGVLTSSPVDLGDAVAFGSRSGAVYCLSKSDGSSMWKFDGPDGFGSSPVAIGGKIVIGCYDGSVFCLDAKDGSRLWRYRTGGRVVSSPAEVRSGIVVIGSFDGFLYCLDREGKLRWRFKSGARIWSSPLCHDGKVLTADVSGRIHCLDSPSGTVLWSAAAGGAVHGAPAAGDDLAYFGAADGTVTAYSLPDGRAVWRYRGDSAVSSSILLDDGGVFVGHEDGSLVRLDARGGTVVWRSKLPGTVRSRPVRDEDALAVTCYDGYLRLLNIATGTVISEFNSGGKIYATPLFASGVAYFGDMNGRFNAIGFSTNSSR